MTITITLPIPARAISPNARRGESRWAAIAKSKVVKSHRQRAMMAMRDALVSYDPVAVAKPLGYSLAHYFPTAAYRDEDNADGACKAYKDGICDAMGMDDKHFNKLQLSTRVKDKENPRLEITVYYDLMEARRK